MLVELRVIGEDEARIEAAVEELAAGLGVVAHDVTFERAHAGTIIGAALGRFALGESAA